MYGDNYRANIQPLPNMRETFFDNITDKCFQCELIGKYKRKVQARNKNPSHTQKGMIQRGLSQNVAS